MGRLLMLARQALDESDGEKSEKSEISRESLVVKELEGIIKMRERGEVPPHYTAVTNCQRCGTVPVWPGCPSEVIACPWCFTGRLPK